MGVLFTLFNAKNKPGNPYQAEFKDNKFIDIRVGSAPTVGSLKV